MTTRSPVIDPQTAPKRLGSGYPPEFAGPCVTRIKRQLGDAAGLTNFGVNLTELPPGCWSSQRHWHTKQDEFIYVVEGEITLVTDAGETLLKPGMCAGFPAGKPDGHHLINKSDRPAKYLEVGDRTAGDEGHYPDVDMQARFIDGKYVATRRDGTPY
ncbi:MAG: cupin domain-containing protein [Alphaproteobacteria bacterium]|nr:cupin domain-containing protein [Alphaproteobacteria bacterium]